LRIEFTKDKENGMKRNLFVILFAILALIFASLACNAVTGGGNDNGVGGNDNSSGFSFTTANIQNAHMARDADDTDRTDVFSPDDPTFYCFFELKNAPDSTVVRGAWTLVQADGYESNSLIDEGQITSGDADLYFTLDRGESPWPVGQYKLDIYIDDNLVQTLNFEVR
jgi:predicted small secreted protein